ncbi:sensor histidine kinase [Breznakiella homolactica]|uniref:histidine kinase n=1 Tax=Breznakiella homolactica TaxID=2798577 RepID=A0A7T7XQL7_9SPIR|nr:ATP-binding protein [Breznakiella homolactica]QQO10691.1 sensor histidine kinase [Breznakiella homolactica]
MKIATRTSSLIVALACWILGSALTVFIFLQMYDRARLIRDNDNERILTTLFASLRDYEDFGSAIDDSAVLKSHITGLAVYREDLGMVYSWGEPPALLDQELLDEQIISKNGRITIADPQGKSIKFIVRTEIMAPPPPQPDPHRGGHMQDQRMMMRGRQPPFFSTLDRGSYLYIDLYNPEYWRTDSTIKILFPICELALLFIVFYIRRLFLRNIEYRERIEGQKNLVVLGTAASTLAHEIKNPLSSIRLQTGILKKLGPENGTEEIAIIDQEVERLSALVYRVNDYLRDARGFPVPQNVYALLEEISQRICGKNIVDPGTCRDCAVFIDSDRARSVLENILRNALESGSSPEGVTLSAARSNGNIVIKIADRGKGIPAADRKRIFDPFFTSKSTGTGIGLSISKRFTEAANGSIAIESRDGGGTVVAVTFPEYTETQKKDL